MLLGGCIGYLLSSNPSPTSTSQSAADDYPLLSRRIFIENPNDTRINFSGLRSQARDYFTSHKLKGSLYFEYLPTGTSVRVNGDEQYRAASLIKLPVAMELYKASELGLLDLDSKTTLKEEWLNADYGTLYQKGAGYELTLRDAVTIMLRDSDNTALRAVIDATDKVLPLEYRALGSLDVEFAVTDAEGSIDIGTRSYSSFFKCLYFACYNNEADSQAILQTLTETPFADRLVAGVDAGVQVSHKIGVFNTKIQSDCGIIYIDKNNYVLCIMLEGDDTDKTNQTIAEISRLVFDFVKSD